MSYSENIIIETDHRTTNYTNLYRLQDDLEEIKILVIIFGSSLIFILMFASIFYVINNCQKVNIKKNSEIQIVPVRNREEESDNSTLI